MRRCIFFSLHYVLPFAIAGVVALHIWALHVPGNNNPLGIDVGAQDTVPFHPYYTVRDLFYLSLFVIVYAYFVFFNRSLDNPDNSIRANPIATPKTSCPNGISCHSTRSCARSRTSCLAWPLFGSLLTLLSCPGSTPQSALGAFSSAVPPILLGAAGRCSCANRVDATLSTPAFRCSYSAGSGRRIISASG
jgi:hypothetical protein